MKLKGKNVKAPAKCSYFLIKKLNFGVFLAESPAHYVIVPVFRTDISFHKL